MSAGSLAIQIPRKFLPILDEHRFGWRRLPIHIAEKQIFLRHNQLRPSNATSNERTHSTPDRSTSDAVLYSLPPTSRITTDSLRVFPSTKKLATAVALLQLVYTAFQVYMQYGVLIRDRGLSTPFIVAVPYLYMSFINLIANLVQGSYTYVTVIEPGSAMRRVAVTISDTDTRPVDAPAPCATAPFAAPMSPEWETEFSHIAGRTAFELSKRVEEGDLAISLGIQSSEPDLAVEFNLWLQAHFPQLEIEEHGSLPLVTFLLHHAISLVVILTWIGFLTGFRPGADSSQVSFLLAVTLDPVLHLLLAMVQARDAWKPYTSGLGVVSGVKLVAWGANLWGCFVAGKVLFEIYDAQ